MERFNYLLSTHEFNLLVKLLSLELLESDVLVQGHHHFCFERQLTSLLELRDDVLASYSDACIGH